MAKPSISFFLMNFILAFAAIGFILVVFDLNRFAFIAELGVLLTFIFLLAFGMFAVYHSKKWGWTILGATLVLLVVNLFFIFLLTGVFETAHLTALFFSVLGLIIALLNLRETAQESEASEIIGHDKTKDYYPYIDKMEPEERDELSKEEVKTIKEEVKIKTSKKIALPKFVASKETNKYHTSKCGWPRLMKRKNKIYFNSKRKAEAGGFEPHECVS